MPNVKIYGTLTISHLSCIDIIHKAMSVSSDKRSSIVNGPGGLIKLLSRDLWMHGKLKTLGYSWQQFHSWNSLQHPGLSFILTMNRCIPPNSSLLFGIIASMKADDVVFLEPRLSLSRETQRSATQTMWYNLLMGNTQISNPDNVIQSVNGKHRDQQPRQCDTMC